MFMKPYVLLLIFVALISSCKKTEKSYPELPNPVADYMPLSSGNTWTYGVSSNNGGPDYATLTVNASSNTSIIDGKSFSVLTGDSKAYRDTNLFYFYKTGDQYKDYYTTVIDATTGTSFAVPVLLNGRIKNRDTLYYVPDPDATKPPLWMIIMNITNQNYIDVTIRGKKYSNTMTTGVYIHKLYNGSYFLLDSYQFTFAPNVGLIQAATQNQEINLINYSVSP